MRAAGLDRCRHGADAGPRVATALSAMIALDRAARTTRGNDAPMAHRPPGRLNRRWNQSGSWQGVSRPTRAISPGAPGPQPPRAGPRPHLDAPADGPTAIPGAWRPPPIRRLGSRSRTGFRRVVRQRRDRHVTRGTRRATGSFRLAIRTQRSGGNGSATGSPLKLIISERNSDISSFHEAAIQFEPCPAIPSTGPPRGRPALRAPTAWCASTPWPGRLGSRSSVIRGMAAS